MACFGFLVSHVGIFCLLALAQKDGWTCGSDGYWYQNGVKSEYSNCNSNKDDENKDDSKQGKGDAGCSVTTDPGMPATVDRTCILHSSSSEGRCWWTYVPQGVKTASDGRRVPLLVDMHGGGGCASHQYLSSGFKELSDLEAANAGGGFVLVWPQGSGRLWASHGTKNVPSENSKSLPTWNDIDFLEKLVAFMVKSSTEKQIIDPERIYVSGFSLGCMMSHRFSMERSKIVAAFGCHGGELSFYPTNEAEMDADKSAYAIQAMPVYLTIGDNDKNWFPGAQRSWQAWKYWNNCTSNSNKSVSASSAFQEHVASSCTNYTPTLETVMLVIQGGPHAPDPLATKQTWSFLSRYKRSGVLQELPVAPSETFPSPPATNAARLVLSVGPVVWASLALLATKQWA